MQNGEANCKNTESTIIPYKYNRASTNRIAISGTNFNAICLITLRHTTLKLAYHNQRTVNHSLSGWQGSGYASGLQARRN